jgi:glycosyltransferase involved in cell wall biosynthesis
MRVAFLTTDSREHFKNYANPIPYFGTAPEALLEGFKELRDEIEVHVISCLQQPPKSSPSKLAHNIYYHPLAVSKLGWLRTGYRGCISAVRRKLSEIQPSIVHGQGTERDCAISAVQSGFPNVITIHGNMGKVAALIHAKPLTYYWLAARFERWCLRKTDGVVAISSYTAEAVAPYTKRVWLIPNAVNNDFFRVDRQPVTTERLVCIANVSPWKNQTGLIAALDPLRRELDFELRFIGAFSGQDHYSTRFRSMVAERKWCVCTGPLERDALCRELSAATALVLPSFEDNCPMVVLEAAAAGVPIAAANIGGIPDLVEDGRSGLLFDPRNATSISDTVRVVLSDKHKATHMAQVAQSACLEKHGPTSVAQRHLQVYDQVVRSANLSGQR